MAHAAHEAYLETQILTATPQKLRLLLLEGAIRFGRQALEYWGDQAQLTRRCAALARCNDIITELFVTIRDEPSPVLRQVREIYRFLLVRMGDVSHATDDSALREVLAVLESERETWRQVCEQMPEAPVRPVGTSEAGQDVTAAGLGAIGPVGSGPSGPTASSRLSLEA